MDTKFSVAIHILVMISESETVQSSRSLANSVGTNASYIRKVIALLKNANLIESQQGKVGYRLTKKAKDISLLDIYYATQEVEKVSLFAIHKNTNKECPVGRYIEGGLDQVFGKIESDLASELEGQTLEDMIQVLYKEHEQY